MRNLNAESSIERMKKLMNHGSDDAKLKANVSETVEKKVEGPDGKIYGIVRESQKYFIKESNNGAEFNYIGGIGNRSENEYPSYNSALRNLELKIRSINENLNTGKQFNALPVVDTTSEYIIEATSDMRKEIDRQREIMMGAAKIMNENATAVGFVNKPTFKDPEGFGTASDPKSQGAPFTDKATAKLDKDMPKSNKTAKTAGDPFTDEVKGDPTQVDVKPTTKKPASLGDPFTEPAKDILGNSIANKKPSGGKVFTVTEAQLRKIKEGIYDDEDDDIYGDDLLSQFDYDIEPAKIGKKDPFFKDFDNDDDFEEKYDKPYGDDEMESDDTDFDIEIGGDDMDDELMNEGLWDTIKAVGSVGKHFGGKAVDSAKQGAQNTYNNAKQGVQNSYNNAKQGVQNAYNNAKQGVQNAGNEVSKVYNKSQQNSSAQKIQQIATNLKTEIENLNSRTVKAGGQPLNINSVISTISNQLRGSKGANTSKYQAEGIDMDDELMNEITEAVLNAFGDHSTYQKPAFTTNSASSILIKGTEEWDDDSVKGQAPYGTKIGKSNPFTQPVKGKNCDCDITGGVAESRKRQVTEVSGALAQRAKDKAVDYYTDLDNDPLKRSVKKYQTRIFGNYINPKIKSFAESNGFKVKMDGGVIDVLYGMNFIANYDKQTGDVKYGGIGGLNVNNKRKLSRLIDMIKADYAQDAVAESRKRAILKSLSESIVKDLKKKGL